jgi:hypothetical protein
MNANMAKKRSQENISIDLILKILSYSSPETLSAAHFGLAWAGFNVQGKPKYPEERQLKCVQRSMVIFECLRWAFDIFLHNPMQKGHIEFTSGVQKESIEFLFDKDEKNSKISIIMTPHIPHESWIKSSPTKLQKDAFLKKNESMTLIASYNRSNNKLESLTGLNQIMKLDFGKNSLITNWYMFMYEADELGAMVENEPYILHSNEISLTYDMIALLGYKIPSDMYSSLDKTPLIVYASQEKIRNDSRQIFLDFDGEHDALEEVAENEALLLQNGPVINEVTQVPSFVHAVSSKVLEHVPKGLQINAYFKKHVLNFAAATHILKQRDKVPVNVINACILYLIHIYNTPDIEPTYRDLTKLMVEPYKGNRDEKFHGAGLSQVILGDCVVFFNNKDLPKPALFMTKKKTMFILKDTLLGGHEPQKKTRVRR